MDLKGIGKPVNLPPVQGREKVERSISSDKTTDREGNGQAAFSDGGEQHPPMSDEQYKLALEHLRKLQAVKENNLEVVEYVTEGKRFVLLKEPNGKVIRRIAEKELWSLIAVKDKEKGQLLSKTA
ncbi:MAG: hypothetical protein RJB66_2029 [Pseudomonadota bacterium]|jgi:hypothetical protein